MARSGVRHQYNPQRQAECREMSHQDLLHGRFTAPGASLSCQEMPSRPAMAACVKTSNSFLLYTSHKRVITSLRFFRCSSMPAHRTFAAEIGQFGHQRCDEDTMPYKEWKKAAFPPANDDSGLRMAPTTPRAVTQIIMSRLAMPFLRHPPRDRRRAVRAGPPGGCASGISPGDHDRLARPVGAQHAATGRMFRHAMLSPRRHVTFMVRAGVAGASHV